VPRANPAEVRAPEPPAVAAASALALLALLARRVGHWREQGGLAAAVLQPNDCVEREPARTVAEVELEGVEAAVEVADRVGLMARASLRC